jgi:hypothetical protein
MFPYADLIERYHLPDGPAVWSVADRGTLPRRQRSLLRLDNCGIRQRRALVGYGLAAWSEDKRLQESERAAQWHGAWMRMLCRIDHPAGIVDPGPSSGQQEKP